MDLKQPPMCTNANKSFGIVWSLLLLSLILFLLVVLLFSRLLFHFINTALTMLDCFQNSDSNSLQWNDFIQNFNTWSVKITQTIWQTPMVLLITDRFLKLLTIYLTDVNNETPLEIH